MSKWEDRLEKWSREVMMLFISYATATFYTRDVLSNFGYWTVLINFGLTVLVYGYLKFYLGCGKCD